MLALLAGAACAFVYGMFIEPRRLEVVETEARLDGWPADVPPARIVLLADPHPNDREGAWIDEVVQRTLSCKPEAVILLGDYHNALDARYSMADTELARRLAPLAAYCPVYYVCGNHDYFELGERVRAAFNAEGFVDIEEKTVTLYFANGRRAKLRGAAHDEEPLPPGRQWKRFSRQELPPDLPLIAATHSPHRFLTWKLKADLAVTGHTHGGQICFPGGMPIIARKPWTREMMLGGWHKAADGFPLYVTRGIGMSTLPIRMFCKPEITLLSLRGSGRPLSSERGR